MTCATKRRGWSSSCVLVDSETRHRSSRASCAPTHSGWYAAKACQRTWLASDAPLWYLAVSGLLGLDKHTETAPTAVLRFAPALPTIGPGRRAGPSLRRTKLYPDRLA